MNSRLVISYLLVAILMHLPRTPRICSLVATWLAMLLLGIGQALAVVQEAAPQPVVVPVAGTYAVPLVVQVAPERPRIAGLSYRYTVDGSDPTATSWLYEGGILISDPTQVRIRGFAAGRTASAVTTATYQMNFPLTTKRPAYALKMLPAGTVQVSLNCPTVDAEIVYTTDGTEPNPCSPRYRQPLVLTPTQVALVRARAYGGRIPYPLGRWTVWLGALVPSGVAFPPPVVAPTETVAAPQVSLVAGTYRTVLTTTATCATAGAVIRYTLDGSDPDAAAPVFPSALAIERSFTLTVRGFKTGSLTSPVVRVSYELQTPDPSLVPAGGDFTNIVSVQVQAVGASDTLRATTDGSDPTDASPIISDPIPVSASATASAIIALRAERAGWSPSAIVRGTYRLVVATPTWIPIPGYLAAPTLVVPQSETLQVAFRYTTNGSVPTVDSLLVPADGLLVAATTTITVVGFREGFVPSQPAVATYHLPLLSWSQHAWAGTEGGSVVSATVRLSESLPIPCTVTIERVAQGSTADEFFDASLPEGGVIFPAGTTEAVVPIGFVDDAIHEPTEQMVHRLLPPSGVVIATETGVSDAALATLTITDNDPVPALRFAQASLTCDDIDGGVPIRITLAGSSSLPSTAVVTAIGGTAQAGIHYSFAATPLTIAPFETTDVVYCSVAALADAHPDMTVVFRVSADAGQPIAEPSTCTLTIRSRIPGNPVVTWNDRARAVVARTNTDPPMAARVYALMGVAQRRAVLGLPVAQVSPAGAVTGAALEVLTRLFPAFAGEFLADATADLASPHWNGLPSEMVLDVASHGRQIGAAVVAEAAGDGTATPWLGTPPTGPQYWFASWSYAQPPLRPLWGQARTWFLDTGSEFRPAPPPAFDSAAYHAALTEVRTISDRRTAEQLAIAGKWADGPGSPTPSGSWLRIADDLILSQHLSITEAAKLSGLLGATLFDASVACWDAKYAFWLIRPYQADRSIITPIGQPNFPSFVSGHATFSGAASEILAQAFPAAAETLRAQAEEAALSRLYGGIHYRFDNEQGLVLGRQIAAKALAADAAAAGGAWNRDRAPRLVLTGIAPGAILAVRRPNLTIQITDDAALPVQPVTVTLSRAADDVAIPAVLTGSPGPDGVSWQGSVTPVSDLADGLYRVNITATDSDGLVGQGRISFGVDPTGPPVVTISTPHEQDLVGMTVPVRLAGSVSKPVPVLTLNSTAIPVAADGTFAIDLPIDPNTAIRQPLTLMGGINELALRAVDAAGLAGVTRVTIRVDDHAPTLAVEYPSPQSEVTSADLTVFGRVQDLVLGQVTTDKIAVTVNGRSAVVRNGSFQVDHVALALGGNDQRVVAIDMAGNRSELISRVERKDPVGNALLLVSGDQQETAPYTALAQPLVVKAVSRTGAPIPHQPVTFQVSRGDGTLVEAVDNDHRQVTQLTDANGWVSVQWRAGGNAGLGTQRVTATAPGVAIPVTFTGSLTPADPTGLYVIDGDQQTGFPGQALYRPLVVVARDRSGNPVPGQSVLIEVVRGSGGITPVGATGPQSPSLTLITDADGYARVLLYPGTETGPETTSVRFTLVGSASALTRTLVASVITGSGRPEDTGLAGVVMSTEHQPIPGVTLVIEGTTIGAVSDAQGKFAIRGAPAGHRHLQVQGATANTSTVQYPTIGFEVDLLAGGLIHMPMPIYLPTMDRSNEVLAGGDQEVTITIPGSSGAQVVIAPHSTIRADGTRGPVWMFTSPVNAIALPMPIPGGSAPVLAATLQPSGTRLDPPARVRWPNQLGFLPGAQVPLLSFDHDLGQFVGQGTMTVADDGLMLVSDPGTGLSKAGWHLPDAPPVATATCTVESPPNFVGDMFVTEGQEFECKIVRNGQNLSTTWKISKGLTAELQLGGQLNNIQTFVAVSSSKTLVDHATITASSKDGKSSIVRNIYIAPKTQETLGKLAWEYDVELDQYVWNAKDKLQAPPWWSIPYAAKKDSNPYGLWLPIKFLVFGYDYPDSSTFAPDYAATCGDTVLLAGLKTDAEGNNYVGRMLRNKYIPALTKFFDDFYLDTATFTYLEGNETKSGTFHQPEILLSFLRVACADKLYDGDMLLVLQRYQQSKELLKLITPKWTVAKDVTVLDAAGTAFAVLGAETNPLFWLKAVATNNYKIDLPKKGETTVASVTVEGGMLLFGGYASGKVFQWIFRRLKAVKPHAIDAFDNSIGFRPLRNIKFNPDHAASYQRIVDSFGYDLKFESNLAIKKATGEFVPVRGSTTFTKVGERGLIKIDPSEASLWTYIDEFSHAYNNRFGRGVNFKEPTAALHKEYRELYSSAKEFSNEINDEFHKAEIANMILGMDKNQGGNYPIFIKEHIDELKEFCAPFLIQKN